MRITTAIIITTLFALFDLSVPLWAGWYVKAIDMNLIIYAIMGALILIVLQISLIVFTWVQYIKDYEQKKSEQ